MKISIFGLGYVGAVSLGCLARDNNEVIGVDIDPVKLDLIKSGKSPVIEAGMPELIRDAAASGRVSVTTDVGRALRESEISFICVGTPSGDNGSQDQSAIIRLFEEIGDSISNIDSYHVFVVRSTLTPGTVEQTLKPIIEQRSGKRDGVDFDLCFQPEFLREGTSIKDYDNPPYTVIGANSERAAEKLRDLFGHLPCEFYTCSIPTAETLKCFCNIFHALKITFANEVGRLCQSLDVDALEVMDLLCRDKHLNISTAYLKPGFAFGGSCLPKDLRAMQYLAKQNDVEIPMLSGVSASNQVHVEHAIKTLLKLGKKKIGMVGLSFKSGTDDLRESPLVYMAEQLIGKGMDLSIYDPEVNISRLIGANKRFIEESIPHIGSLMTDDCSEMLANSEIIIVGLNDKNLLEQVQNHSSADKFILDLVNIPNHEALQGQYLGVCW